MKKKIFGIIAVITIAILAFTAPTFAQAVSTESHISGTMKTSSTMPIYRVTSEEIAKCFEGMTEAEVLAKFIDCEGGELFEKTLIAEIVCDLRKEWKLESVQEVLSVKRYFYFDPEYWNSFDTPQDSSIAIANMVLELADSQEDYVSRYSSYCYSFMPQEETFRTQILRNCNYFETERYVFIER